MEWDNDDEWPLHADATRGCRPCSIYFATTYKMKSEIYFIIVIQ